MKMRFVMVVLVLLLAGVCQAKEKLTGYAEWRMDGLLIVGGQRVIYSDDDTKGQLADENAPIQFKIQGAKLERDPTGKLVPKANTAIKGFRKYVGSTPRGEALADDGATGFRFELVLDRSFGKPVEIKSIEVFWKL